MRAFLREKGFTFTRDHPLPRAPKANSEEVLVKVRSAGINPVDYKAPKFVVGPIVGLDFAGVVEQVAEGGGSTHGLKVGDEVYGTTLGSLADYSLVPDGNKIAKKPASLSFAQAAAMPTAYLTGLQALRDHGGLREGGRALVIGASGGCGLAGVQLAKQLGAKEVVGICSAKNQELVERMGATRVIDYHKEKVSDVFGSLPDEKKFDVVYDCATNSGGGEDYVAESYKVLKSTTGQYVPINGSPWSYLRFAIGWQRQNMHLFVCKASGADLTTLGGFAEAKAIDPVIAKEFPFTAEGVKEGFAMLKGRRTVGKVVFNMDG